MVRPTGSMPSMIAIKGQRHRRSFAALGASAAFERKLLSAERRSYWDDGGLRKIERFSKCIHE